MSGAPARLRLLFGDELLTRAGRTTELTPLAEGLVVPVGDLMAEADRIVAAERSFDPRNDSRTFTVAADDYALM